MDELWECVREREPDASWEPREALRERLPLREPALRGSGISQSAPMALRALKMASIASAGWLRDRMPNCHLVGLAFFAGKAVIGSGLGRCGSGSVRKLGFNRRALAARCSSVCPDGDPSGP